MQIVMLPPQTATTRAWAVRLKEAVPELVPLLSDRDPDVVRAAALALARLHAVETLPALTTALAAATFDETRCDLAKALARLGSDRGIPVLLDGLDHRDDLVRESFFEAFFDVTGWHLCYDPHEKREERLEARRCRPTRARTCRKALCCRSDRRERHGAGATQLNCGKCCAR